MHRSDAPAHWAGPRKGPAGRLHVVTESNTDNLVDSQWIAGSSEENLSAREFYSWSCEAPEITATAIVDVLADEGELIATAHYRRAGKAEVLVRLGGSLVALTFVPPHRLGAGVAARTQAKAAHAVDRLLALFPEQRSKADNGPSIPLSVWTQNHAEPTRRNTDVASWEDISTNYAASTRGQLDRLMDPRFEVGRGGKLLLFHGAPGTGKSTALATLAWQWRHWSELHYIADPYEFLSLPEYLIHVSISRRQDDMWRVVLLEDAGGLFAPDARQQSGEDRLGRLLNITDGLLAKSSKALFVITTNEPLANLHDAVARPGRCAAAVDFLPFSEAEAKRWLESMGRPDLARRTAGSRTLAELYGLLQGAVGVETPRQLVGFRPGRPGL